MSDRIGDLGAVVVLDPSDLAEGNITVIDGQPLKVSKIDGESVYLTPLTGFVLWRYRWTNELSIFGKIIFTLLFLSPLLMLLFFLK